jgi:hypothetical protein
VVEDGLCINWGMVALGRYQLAWTRKEEHSTLEGKNTRKMNP